MRRLRSACDPGLVDRELRRLRRRRRLRRYWAPVVGVGLVCMVLFYFIIGLRIVSGASMAPSVLPGDMVIYLRLDTEPENGDLVILREPSGTEIVKRVVGVAGDVLELTPDGHIIRNGALLQEDTVWYGGQDTGQWIGFPVTVPEGTVFCLGDNRPLSLDSRHKAIGPIPLDEVMGRVLFVLREQR